MVNVEKLSKEELDNLLKEIENEKMKRDGLGKLKNLLTNEDFLTTFLSSKPFVAFCCSNGYNLSSDDIVDVVLPKYLDLFKGGLNIEKS